MQRRKFKIDEISIGDSVFFECSFQSNYDLYWKVTAKLPNDRLQLKVNEMGVNSTTIIYVNDVIAIEPRIS